MFILLIISTVGIAMILYEYSRPGRNWPAVQGWWLRAILFNSFQVFSVWFAGVAWDGWLVQHRLFSLARLGTYGGALLGYFVTTFAFYWWHRWRHASPFLWRWVHQIHHSPQRLEVITSFYKHPVEILLDSLIMSVILYLGVGLEPVAAAGAVMLSGLAELVYHWNVKTPHWLGYIFQRPESHCIHHQEGVHAFNYSDLPMWDMLFGTYRNPREWDGRCGFGPEREFRVAEMLRGIDIHPADASKVTGES
jgi:sterol desaturase/sphingolipid hydroxylase (fatty acid hydroxylase superfamily)